MIFETYTLGELVSIKYGKNQKKVLSDTGTVPIYGTGGLMGYATEALYDKPSVLIGRKGTIEKIRYVDHPFWTVDTLFYTIVNESIVVPQFLYYTMLQLDLLQYNEGTTIPSLRTETLNRIELQIPSIDNQKRILRYLATIDNKITLNTAINENLHQLIAAYYAEIFGNCEFSATISDYADKIFSGGTPTTSNESYWNGEFKWLSSGETSQKYIVDTEKTITQQGVENSSTRLASKYDTVIASAGQGHTRGQTSMLLTDTYVNQSIIVVNSDNVLKPFIYWNLCGRYEELRVISNSNSIRGSLTTKMISSFSAPKADLTLINKFSELAWAAILEIEKNCNEITRLTALRDTLLPKLMNGEIDVSEVKI